jgi:hypothetical protein
MLHLYHPRKDTVEERSGSQDWMLGVAARPKSQDTGRQDAASCRRAFFSPQRSSSILLHALSIYLRAHHLNIHITVTTILRWRLHPE